MAEEEKSKPGLQLSLGNIHLTATVALIGTVVSGFYAGVAWVTHVREQQDHNTAEIEELGHKIDGLTQVINAFNERHNSNDDSMSQKIFAVQQQLTEMISTFHNVQRLEDRYEGAFSRYQPQPKRR